MTSPRAVLTMIGVRLQQLQPARREQVIGRGVCGQLTVTMSIRASIWSRLSQ